MSQSFKHTFKYTAPQAKSVFVTGTFDNWSKTQALQFVADGVFTGTLEIPYDTAGQAILYKYVVDDQWFTDNKAETNTDASGNMNNIIHAPAEQSNQTSNQAETTAAAAATATEQPKQEQLPPLFVPPVVLPSDKEAYQAALAKGDNEVVQPQSTNLESFPVVENDVDRANSPVIVEPPHPVQEPEHDKVAEPPVATPPENIEAVTETSADEQPAATTAVEQPAATNGTTEPAVATSEATPQTNAVESDEVATANVDNAQQATQTNGDTAPATEATSEPQPSQSTSSGLKKSKGEKKGSLGAKIKGLFKKL